MGALIYKKSFDLELSHTFFSAASEQFQLNNDIDFAPTAATAALLGNNRMRWAKTGKGISVFYKAMATNADESTTVPMAQLSGSPEFLFTFTVLQDLPRFINITDLGSAYRPGKKLMLSGTHNTTGAATITLTSSLVDMVTANAFTYEFRRASGSGNVDVKVYDESNTLKQTISAVESDSLNVFRAAIDLRSEAKGLYTLKVFNAGTATLIQSVTAYVDNDLAGTNFFGFVRLRYNTAAELYTAADTFKYAFSPRSVKWRYFVVVKKDDNDFFNSDPGNKITIDGAGASIAFTPANATSYSSYTVNDNKVIVFTSSASIAFSSNPKTIKLKQIGQGAKDILQFMPNASYNNPDSDRMADGNGPYAEVFVFVESIRTS